MSNSVYIPSNVQVVLKNGVVLKNIYETGGAGYPPSNNVFSLCPPSKSKIKGSCKKVSGAKNISITGKGNATIDNNFVEGGGTIVISHNKNVKVSGITFKNQNGGHFLEITGVENVVIENCTFKGSKASTRAKNYMKEAINLDTPDPETHGLNAVWVAQDRTDNKNITISELPKLIDNVKKKIDIHFMVNDPTKYIEKICYYNIEYITIHYEIKNLEDYIDKIKNYGFKVGIAIKPETDIEKIYYLLDGYSCLLSEGKWSKENNELFLYDPVLEYSFKGFVQSDGLRMTRFPNELNLKWDYHLVSDEAYPFIVW